MLGLKTQNHRHVMRLIAARQKKEENEKEEKIRR